MKRISTASPLTLDEHLLPPFNGFPKEGIQFLVLLKRNNNRSWFESHKSDYEEFVRFPMQMLLASLRGQLAEFAPDFNCDPRRSIFRIYRDIRFSKDKTPYKTHVAAHIVMRGKQRGLEGLGYYIHIEPGEVFLGAGIYIPSGDQLKKIRSYLGAHIKEFQDILSNKQMKKLFGTIDGERLKRVPIGYSPDHPLADWLRLKQFFVGVSRKHEIALNKSFVSLAAETFRAATPLVRFLANALG